MSKFVGAEVLKNMGHIVALQVSGDNCTLTMRRNMGMTMLVAPVASIRSIIQQISALRFSQSVLICILGSYTP